MSVTIKGKSITYGYKPKQTFVERHRRKIVLGFILFDVVMIIYFVLSYFLINYIVSDMYKGRVPEYKPYVKFEELPKEKFKIIDMLNPWNYLCTKKWNCAAARAVVMAESRGNCGAVNYNTNGTKDTGYFQINDVHQYRFKGRDPFNCIHNIDIAYEIYKEQGFNPWVGFWSNGWLKYYDPQNGNKLVSK